MPTVLTAVGVKRSGQSMLVSLDAGLASLMWARSANAPTDAERGIADLRAWLDRVADDIRHHGG